MPGKLASAPGSHGAEILFSIGNAGFEGGGRGAVSREFLGGLGEADLE